jgi:CII-binding regulator of phage lambda lysogenization HflD
MDIKKINEELTKRIKDNTYDITIVKKKIENINEQIKEINKSINNMKMRNLNASTIMNNRSKLNISNSLSPYKEKKNKADIRFKNNFSA